MKGIVGIAVGVQQPQKHGYGKRVLAAAPLRFALLSLSAKLQHSFWPFDQWYTQ